MTTETGILAETLKDLSEANRLTAESVRSLSETLTTLIKLVADQDARIRKLEKTNG